MFVITLKVSKSYSLWFHGCFLIFSLSLLAVSLLASHYRFSVSPVSLLLSWEQRNKTKPVACVYNWGLWLGLFFLASSSLVSQKDLQVPGGARLFHASLAFITLPPVLELKPFTTLQTQVKHHHFCDAILALFSVLRGNGHFLGATPCPQPFLSVSVWLSYCVMSFDSLRNCSSHVRWWTSGDRNHS